MIGLPVILGSVVAVSLIAFVGIVFVGFNEEFLRRILVALVGFASGSLLGGAFLHLFPESLEESGNVALYYALFGIVAFFFMEKFLYWRHCHEENCPIHMFVYLNLIGDGLHNLIDGAIIAATFLISYELGIATTLAVVFHEIPQEIGDFGILVYGGLGKRRALIYNFLSAVMAIVGALITYSMGIIRNVEQVLVPFAAGGFIYIAATDLMPELHKQHRLNESLIQSLVIVLGIGLMAFLKIILRTAH